MSSIELKLTPAPPPTISTLGRAAVDLREGDVLPGGFRLVRALGEGTFAFVWLAEQTATGNHFALKIAKNDDALAVLRRQARTPAHPSVVAIHSLQEERAPFFLVMEYVPGTTLRKLIRTHVEERGTGLPGDWALLIFRQVVTAIAHAHAHGIVHGDLKPENILVDDDGNARVTDFGVIRTFDDASVHHSLSTVHRSAPFTPVYLAPEARSADSALTPAGDIYALGVILHEMVAGDLPQGADTLRQARQDAPVWADEIFRRTYTGIARRFPSAVALAHELGRRSGREPPQVVVRPLPAPRPAMPAHVRDAPTVRYALVTYGGFWRRVLAYMIDGVFILLMRGILAVAFGEEASAFLGFITDWLYFAGMESSVGATIGKAAVGVTVVGLDLQPISFGHATLRYFGKILSMITFGVGFLMAGFTERKQALHDMVAGTLVIHRP